MYKKIFCGVFILFLFAIYGNTIELPVNWQYFQDSYVKNTGLVSVKIPSDTIDVSRENLEDIRIFNSAGSEIPYSLFIPAKIEGTERTAQDYKITVRDLQTVIDIKTGISEQIDSIAIVTPANEFLKPVSVFSSSDQKEWYTLAKDKPIFRQYYGIEHLRVEFPKGSYKYLKIFLDDRRKDAIPITGLSVHSASQESIYPDDKIEADIIEKIESPGQTRIVIKLPVKNLRLSKIVMDTAESLFTRQVSILTRTLLQGEIKEVYSGQGTIYRVSVEGKTPFENIIVPVSTQVKSREIILVINNGNSPPLDIKKISVFVKPVFIRFLAEATGTFYLLTGNQLVSAPKYDISELNEYLRKAKFLSAQIGRIITNPKYKPPETLPELGELGSPIDVSDWKYRKAVILSDAGIQKLELDIDVLVHADGTMKDLRLVKDGKQIPYIVERTSILRNLPPAVTNIHVEKKSMVSKWLFTLPQKSIPIVYFSCNIGESIFRRDVSLYEEVLDSRGAIYNRYLGNAVWTKIPKQDNTAFTISLNSIPLTDKIFLEIQNGDNPPLTLSNFQFYYPVTRILFKSSPNNNTCLYYGNNEVANPKYDIDLVANEILSADKKNASLEKEEILNPGSWWELPVQSGITRVIFWIVMVLVVLVLLVVIAKLLPKNS
ncbi:MAG: DUF3999 family protein [Elusimicrobiota bacterium]